MNKTILKKIIISIITLCLLFPSVNAIHSVAGDPSTQQAISNGDSLTYTITVNPTLNDNDGELKVKIESPESNIGIVINDGSTDLATGTGASELVANGIVYQAGVDKILYVTITNNGITSYERKDLIITADDGYPNSAYIVFVTSIEVPEFPTAIIPIAGFLGIVLVIGLRRRKK